MTHDVDALREASERAGVPFDYLQRLAAAEEYDPQDPGGNNTLAKQLTVVFDHYVAKCLTGPDPISAPLPCRSRRAGRFVCRHRLVMEPTFRGRGGGR
jgi:hypothetical protein